MQESASVTQNKEKKNICKDILTLPNIITLCRIPLAAALMLFSIKSAPFIICYILCGITDIADGFLARKLHMETKSGAALDSVCDAVFAVVLAVVYFPLICQNNAFFIAILCVAAIRAASLVICFIRYRRAFFLHNIPNRISGLLIFIFLPLYAISSVSAFAMVCIVAAAISALVELYTMTKK